VSSGERFGSRLLYSQCWEDLACARAALRIQPGDHVLAIAAAGDNVLGMLIDDPARIVAVDLNPAQVAMTELKGAAVRQLNTADLHAFLGLRSTADRWAGYQQLRPDLSEASQRFWDGHRRLIDNGILGAGRFERYVRLFRRIVLPVVPGRRAVRAILDAGDIEAQRHVYARQWDTALWRFLFRIFFSRSLLAAFGRHRSFFAHAPAGDIGAHFLDRVRIGLTSTPLDHNPYLTYLLTGTYRSPHAIPDYLRTECQPIIAARVDRISMVTASLTDALRDIPDRSIDAFYLSDVFELFGSDAYETTLSEIARVGRPGARLCYWNNLVPRHRPARLAGVIATHAIEAAELHRLDRAFLYSRLIIESVKP
jgi:S-adenosylmethionine-diacylglycerol 3-amino-3-carboxypropyl transferase